MAGLFSGAYTIREEGRARQVGNLLIITRHHREIWSIALEHPELRRVLMRDVNLSNEPVTDAERIFVRFLVLHLASAFEVKKRRMYWEETKLHADVQQFFDLPIVCSVWNELREFQEADFVRFIEDVLHSLTRFVQEKK